MDAAALYFVETAFSANEPGRGGDSGYLSSDAGATNEFLLSDWNKLLVGYPLVPGAQTNWGRMYATMPANLRFASLSPKVFRTTDFFSYPGNSGGSLYVQWTNGVYYPAGIYLGGGAQSLVRAIDGEVVDLTGVVYRIDYASNLSAPSNWVALTNVTLSNSSQVIGATGPTNGTERFFRALRTP